MPSYALFGLDIQEEQTHIYVSNLDQLEKPAFHIDCDYGSPVTAYHRNISM
jgi:hypothetical protein